MKKWTPPRKAGGIPGASIRFSLNMENEQDDARNKGEGNHSMARNVSKASRPSRERASYSSTQKRVGMIPGVGRGLNREEQGTIFPWSLYGLLLL